MRRMRAAVGGAGGQARALVQRRGCGRVDPCAEVAFAIDPRCTQAH